MLRENKATPKVIEAYKMLFLTIQSMLMHIITLELLEKLGKLEEAIDAYGKGDLHQPDYAHAYNNTGMLKDQGKLEEAIEAYNRAVQCPNYAEAARTPYTELLKIYTPDDKTHILFKK